MSKHDLKLDLGMPLEPDPTPAKPAQTKTFANEKNNKKSTKGKSGRPNIFQRIAKVFREMISETKKVDWPAFKRTKNNAGVLTNTSTVLLLTLFFLVLITSFDFGLAALLRLLVAS
ncbi:MAG: preprotein translocase subunit SecE [Christensenellaceae bacterium]|jgi:preprotein translocase subunit SecE|nr:preprotein translocase subunit SecE [Christensenellaceae bacterium]